jgi:hypothetical protein
MAKLKEQLLAALRSDGFGTTSGLGELMVQGGFAKNTAEVRSALESLNLQGQVKRQPADRWVISHDA